MTWIPDVEMRPRRDVAGQRSAGHPSIQGRTHIGPSQSTDRLRRVEGCPLLLRQVVRHIRDHDVRTEEQRGFQT